VVFTYNSVLGREEKGDWWQDYKSEEMTPQRVSNAYRVMQTLFIDVAGEPLENFNELTALNIEIESIYHRVNFGRQATPIPNVSIILTSSNVKETIITLLFYLTFY
jgi:hypothetical protein